jgi:hypothetical protein
VLFDKSRPATIVHAKTAIVWLRIASSCAWIAGACVGNNATLTPAFLNGSALVARISGSFVHTALDSRIAQVLTWYIVPHAALAARLIACADAAIIISLLFGIAVRFGGMLAIVRTLMNIAVAAGTGLEVIGFNGMLLVAAAICIGTGAGRTFGLDARLIDRYPLSEFLRIIA